MGMTRSRKFITIGLWAFVVVGLIGLLAIQRQRSERARLASIPAGNIAVEIDDQGRLLEPSNELPVLFDAPRFTLIDQTGKPFESASLKGKVWTTTFFFSECDGVCPGMMARLRSLQSTLRDERISFVSFTVDPANDTPERLAEYAASIGPGEQRWHLLTGTVDEMKRVAMDFKLPYEQPADHSSKILLIDQAGRVRGLYSTGVADEMRQLVVDASSLLDSAQASAGQ